MPLIQEYEQFVESLEQSEQNKAYLKANFLYNGLCNLNQELFTVPNHTLSKYINNELLRDREILDAFNEIRQINNIDSTITIEDLYINTCTLAQDHQELINQYPLVSRAIENSSMSNDKKHELRTLYVSQLLDNKQSNNLFNIENSNLPTNDKNSLKALYVLEYAKHNKGNFYNIINSFIKDQSFKSILQDQQLLKNFLESIPKKDTAKLADTFAILATEDAKYINNVIAAIDTTDINTQLIILTAMKNKFNSTNIKQKSSSSLAAERKLIQKLKKVTESSPRNITAKQKFEKFSKKADMKSESLYEKTQKIIANKLDSDEEKEDLNNQNPSGFKSP